MSSGRRYFFSVTLYTNTSQHFQAHGLDNDDIVQFCYTNEANKLFLTGELVYNDRYGAADKYIDKQFSYAEIVFSEIESESDGDTEVQKLAPATAFKHTFFITGMEILSREKAIITYRMKLVSTRWFNCVGNISYSNYDKPPETVFELIKTVLGLNDLDIDPETFDKVKTTVKLNYITHGNDTSLSAVKYLLSRLYYYDTKDDTIKFIYYNDIKDKYNLFSIMDKETATATHSIIMSMFNTQNEKYTQESDINLATVTKMPKLRTFKSLQKHKHFGFDMQHNKFLDKSVKHEDLIKYYNQHYQEDVYKDKFEKVFQTTLKFVDRGTYWNSNELENAYDNVLKTMFEDNALVMNCAGVINRKPGDFMQVSVDRPKTYVETEHYESEDSIKKKYRSIEGTWIVSKVRHMVFPAVGQYKQNIVMFRNYTYEDETELSQ